MSNLPSKKLPTITSQIPRDLRLFTDRLRELVDDLGGGSTTILQSSSIGNSGSGGSDPDVEVPTVPTGFQVSPGFGIFYLEWDYPSYAGHAYTKIYGAQTDDVGVKSQIGIATGTTFVYEAGNNAYWCFWISHVNQNDVESALNATAGTCGTTTIDPADVIPLLEDQLDESHLTAALNERLDGIDDELLPDSIISRVTLIDDPLNALSVVSRLTSAEGTIVDHADDISTLQGTVDDPDTGVVATYSITSGLVSELGYDPDTGVSQVVADFTLLEAAVEDPDTGLSAVNTLASGISSVIGFDPVGGTSSLVIDFTNLENTVEDPDTGLAATTALATQVGSSIGFDPVTGISSLATDFTALEQAVDDPSTGLAAVNTLASGISSAIEYNPGTGVSAIASDFRSLESTVNDPDSGLAATANAVSTLETDVGTWDGLTSISESLLALQAVAGGGRNLLLDARFTTNPGTYWQWSTNAGFSHYIENSGDSPQALTTESEERTYRVATDNVQGTNSSHYAELASDKIPVIPEQRYCFSVYAGAYRLRTYAFVYWFQSNGSYIDIAQTAETTGDNNGTTLDTFERIYAFATAPANAAYAVFYLRSQISGSYPTSYGYSRFVRPMFSTVSDDQVSPPPWDMGGEPPLFAALEEKGMVSASEANGGTASATYTLKLRARDNTGEAQVGFGMAAVKETSGEWVADVRFSATRFAIMAPASYDSDGTLAPGDYPFIVQSSNRTIDGEFFPAGVYIKAAFIDAATISNAMINDATITDAKIASLSADKITAGSIAVGRYIQSASYGATGNGWRINGNGEAIFGETLGERMQWDGSRLSIYNSANELVLSSGDKLYAAVTQNLLKSPRFNGPGWLSSESNAGTYSPGVATVYTTTHEYWFSTGLTQYTANGNALAEPYDGTTAVIAGQLGTSSLYYLRTATLYQGSIPVAPNQKYAAYVYSGAHRCTAYIFVNWYDSVGGFLDQSTFAFNDAEKLGGPQLTDFKLIGGFCTAPPNAATATVFLWMTRGTTGTIVQPYTFWVRPYFGPVSATQQVLPVWTDYQERLFLTATNASTYIKNAAIDTAQIADAAIETAKINDLAVNSAKIANAAITDAKIANAAITNAKIGTAAVDTLKVAGGTVTSMGVDIDAWVIGLTTTYQDGPLAGASLVAGASGVVIICTMTLGGNTVARQGYMRVVRTTDSAVIGEGSILSQANDGPAATYAFFDPSPPAGYVTYRVQVKASATGINSGYRSIVVVGGRR